MAIREGTWDCPSCGTRVRGPLTSCSKCGAPRPAGIRFNPPGVDATVVTDPDQIREAKSGPDWYCSKCGSANKATRGNCRQCGAERGASLDHFQTQRPSSGKSSARITYTPEPEVEAPTRRQSTYVPEYRRSDPERTIVSLPVGMSANWLIGMVGLLVLIAIGYLIFHTTDTTMTISGFSWQRSISIEEYRTVTESDWSVPAGGRMVSSSRQIRRYEQVLDHYKTVTYTEKEQTGTEEYVCGTESIDLGNGHFDVRDKKCTRPTYSDVTRTRQEPVYRDEPVYDTKYTYQIDKWVGAGSVPAGDQDHNARWPEVSLGSNRRESGRSESYSIRLSANDGQDIKTYTTSNHQEWMSYEMRQQVIVTTNGFGAVTSIKPAP